MKQILSKSMTLFMVFFVCAVSNVKAQDVVVATLQSGNDVQVFYGATGLQKAVEAAVDGDQISLSGGTFNTCTINKPLKIYGAGGFVQDAANNRYKTILNGDFTIELPEGAKGMYIEGIYTSNTINVKGVIEEMTLKRSHVNFLRLSECETTNCNIVNCEIPIFCPDAHSKNLTLRNSAYNFRANNAADANLNIINCIQTQGDNGYPTAAVYKNSIIVNQSKSPYISYYYTAYYSYGYAPSNSAILENCISNVQYKDIMVSNTFYELKDEWKEKLIGDDGTEMGIYGGTTPFTNVPSNPQITSKEIARQSDANGKLAVKIVVEAQK